MAIELPDTCLRGYEDCEPLAQIASDCGTSFICCGENDGSTRQVEQDRFRVCWKNEDIDEESDWDERDLINTISVLSGALSVDANRKANGCGNAEADTSGLYDYVRTLWVAACRR